MPLQNEKEKPQKILLSPAEAIAQFKELANSESTIIGFIKPSLEDGLRVRFVFSKILRSQTGKDLALLSGITPDGLARLANHSGLDVCIMLADRQYQFHTTRGKEHLDGMLVIIPQEVYCINNRKEQRFRVPKGTSIFYHPKDFKVLSQEIASPPVFGFYENVASWQRVVDLSKAGMMIESRFPNFLKWAEDIRIIDYGMIIAPNMEPIAATAEISWSRRIRERAHSEKPKAEAERKYRLGFSLTFLSEDAAQKYSLLVDQIASLEIDKETPMITGKE